MDVYMAITADRSRHIPKGPALLFRLTVISSAVLLLVFALSSSLHWESLIIVLIAAGGIYIVHKDITHQPFPLWLIFTHGLAALAWLMVQIFSR